MRSGPATSNITYGIECLQKSAESDGKGTVVKRKCDTVLWMAVQHGKQSNLGDQQETVKGVAPVVEGDVRGRSFDMRIDYVDMESGCRGGMRLCFRPWVTLNGLGIQRRWHCGRTGIEVRS